MLLACSCTLFALDLPKPLVNLPLNEEDFAAIKNLGTAAVEVKVLHPEQMKWVDGPDGKAIYFASPLTGNVARGHIQFTMPKEFEVKKPFALSMNVKTCPDLQKKGMYYLMRFSNGCEKAAGINLFITWNMLWFRGGIQGAHVDLQNNTADISILGNQWYRFVAVYDGKEAVMYIDGKAVDRKVMTIDNPNTWQLVNLGSSGDGYGYGFEGILCRFQLFDQALTAEQVAELSSLK